MSWRRWTREGGSPPVPPPGGRFWSITTSNDAAPQPVAGILAKVVHDDIGPMAGAAGLDRLHDPGPCGSDAIDAHQIPRAPQEIFGGGQ